jgi:integrase
MKNSREQKGYIWREGDWWMLRYRDSLVINGNVVRKQFARKLAPVASEHRRLQRPPQDVLKEAKDFLAPLNACLIDPAKKMTLGDFVRNVWLPSVDNRLAASTAYSHRYYWENIIEPRCGSTSLREFSTARVQQLLDEIARQNPEMMKGTLSKVKSILSAIFKHAIQQEYRPGPNPTRETSLPRAPEAGETFAYDLDAVLKMLRLIPEPSRTVIAVAAFTGLRRSEVEGLTWENYFGDALAVTHGVWNGIVGETKNRTSKASVPVIGALRKILDQHRLLCGNPDAGIMFRTKNDTHMRLNNLLNLQILPALERCQHCGRQEADHGREIHEYVRDAARPVWHGWHAFRRGLATNLHDLGVDDMTIQRILRHSHVSVTQRCYIKTLPQQSLNAMNKLDELVERTERVCSERAGNEEAAETIRQSIQ